MKPGDVIFAKQRRSEILGRVIVEYGSGEDAPIIDYPPYTADDFLSEVFVSRDLYNALTGLLRNKKNIILQGAPGVGKTYLAKRLAYSMMGEKDIERLQFHQSYSYEDFIVGYRPSATVHAD